MKMFVRLVLGIALGAALSWTAENEAEAQHFDTFLTSLGAQTGIGAADIDNGMFDVSARVFEGVLVATGGTPDYSRDEPGLFALSNLAPSGLFPGGATAFAPNTLVSLSFQPFVVNSNSSRLFYWDGVGAVNFQPAGVGVSVGLSDSDVLSGLNGEIDFHPDFELDGPGSEPHDGVYLASLTATATWLAPSDPIFYVWLVDDSITSDLIAEEVEEAIEAGEAFQFFEEAAEWVESNLVVPEPASLTVALCGLIGLIAGCRPRRN